MDCLDAELTLKVMKNHENQLIQHQRPHTEEYVSRNMGLGLHILALMARYITHLRDDLLLLFSVCWR